MRRGRLFAYALAALLAVPALAGPASAQSVARTYQLRAQVGGGVVAFDGSAIWYGDVTEDAPVLLHRLNARTGAALGDVAISGLYGLRGAWYGPREHVLYVLALHPECVQGEFKSGCPFPAMYRVGLRDLTAELMFELPNNELRHYTYDQAVDRFRMVDESAQALWTATRTGAMSSCPVAGLGDGEHLFAVVGAGGGDVYARVSDERTLARISGCRIVERVSHAAYGRVSYDSMACDTVTFDRPAAWLRHSDGSRELVTAVTVPRASCPLPTALDPVEARDTDVGTPTPVCARLLLAGPATPVAGERVRFAADGRVIGTATTGADGRACVSYSPPENGTDWLVATAGRLPAYEPSRSEGVINVSGGSPRGPANPNTGVRPDPPRAGDPPAQPAGKPQAAPGSQGQPQPGSQPGTQVDPGTQGAPDPAAAPQVQPGAQPQSQLAAQPQLAVQPQLAAQPVLVPQLAVQPQVADRLAMSRYAAVPLGLATVGMGSIGWVLARRDEFASARCR